MALAVKQRMQAPIAEPSPLRGQRNQSFLHAILDPHRSVTQHAA
jgi:hypothetical protein